MTSKEQFIQAYNDYADALFRYCYFRVFDREQAKELVQEIYIRAWGYVVKGSDIPHMKALLYKIANNIVIDYVKKKKSLSLEALAESGYTPSIDHEQDLKNEITVQGILKVMDQLPKKYKDVIVFKYVDGFSVKEIAKMVAQKENVVSIWLHRGLKQLRQLLENA